MSQRSRPALVAAATAVVALASALAVGLGPNTPANAAAVTTAWQD
jgi:hypothetical protein